MTSNQIAYMQMLEATRHNRATEDISNRQTDETIRHNYRDERLRRDSNDVALQSAGINFAGTAVKTIGDNATKIAIKKFF